MADYQSIFKRTEKKYVVDSFQRNHIEDALAMRMSQNIYGSTFVNSLYFDCSDRYIIARSLEKPIYKEKLRLRWYSDANGEKTSPVFIELKKKFDGVVYKRRIDIDKDTLRLAASKFKSLECLIADSISHLRRYMDRSDPLAFTDMNNELRSSSVSRISKYQIAKEMETFIGRFDGLRPSAFISCERKAYEIPEVDLRITFDAKLVGDDLIFGNKRYALLPESASVMEIKCRDSYPLWLSKLLSDCGAYPSSFSKYGELHKTSLNMRGDLSA